MASGSSSLAASTPTLANSSLSRLAAEKPGRSRSTDALHPALRGQPAAATLSFHPIVAQEEKVSGAFEEPVARRSDFREACRTCSFLRSRVRAIVWCTPNPFAIRISMPEMDLDLIADHPL